MNHIPSQTEAIRCYAGSCEDDWCGLPVEVGPFACVSPVYGRTLATKSPNHVRLSDTTIAVIQDSGAFCDGIGQRISFDEALRRQIDHAEQFGYYNRITHRASYDLLIDEKWDYQGRRYKSRWSEEAAWDACITTIKAAKYLACHRENLHCIFSAQGVTASQYLACVQGVLPSIQDGDMLGLGGFCVVGRIPRQIMPVFREIIHTIIPFIGGCGVKQIHIWGCLYAPALGELLWLCDRYGIKLSTDSVYPSLRPVLGRWGYASWTDPTYKYRRPPVGPELARDRKIHCELVRNWLAHFRAREPEHYRWRAIRKQHRIFDDEEVPILSEVGKEDDASNDYCTTRWNGLGRMDTA